MWVELLKRHPRKLATAACGILLVMGGQLASSLIPASYDWSFARSSAPVQAADVAVIYLDLESYLDAKQNPAEPWDRSLHAKLVRRLTEARARAIVFDVIFDLPGKEARADAEFAEAIRASGRVILAAELEFSSRRTSEALGSRDATLVLPHEPFRHVAAGWGLAKLIIDEDLVVRRFFPGLLERGQPSLSWAVAEFLKLPALDAKELRAASAWVRYYGPPLTIPHVSYRDALNPGATDDSFFRDKIVFVGARPVAGAFSERKDEFRTPFSRSARRDIFMPAVEIHATEMLNLLRGDWLRRPASTLEEWLLVASAAAISILLMRFRPVFAAGVAVVCEALVLLVGRSWLPGQGTWFPWLIVSAVQIPGALAASILYHSIEWYQTRRRLEAQRREAEARIREQAALLDKAQDAILVQSLQWRIVYANPSAERLFGWSAVELRADAAGQQLFAPAAGKVAEMRELILTKGEWIGEIELAARSGQKLVVESRWTLIRDEAGKPKSVMLINTDVTERKRLEAQFLRAQRMDTIGSLAGGLAHDLNNALSPILIGIQFIARKPQDDETRQVLAAMEANTHRGADMVRQVLTFSRGHGSDKELLNVGRLVRELENIVRQTFPKSITVAAMVPRDLWPLVGNATQIHQVLLNLCVNARDAMADGGELTLAADNVELGPEEARENRNATPGRYVMVMVSDTGTGIDPQALPRIFEEYFTTKAPGKGTGLGLATVARIVRNHKGFCNVRSELKVGTSFEVYFPAVEVAPAPALAQPVEQLPCGRGEIILMIESDRSVREMVASSLGEHGYRVLSAANAEEALAAVDGQTTGIHLVLADLDIAPIDGKDGIDLIRARCPNVPVILVGEESDFARKPSLAGVSAVLPKPFVLEQLLNSIAACLRRIGRSPAN